MKTQITFFFLLWYPLFNLIFPAHPLQVFSDNYSIMRQAF